MSSMKLVCERKIGALLPSDRASSRWEASGVLAKDGYYFIVFDNRSEVARIADDLEPNKANGLFGRGDIDCGYEGITYNTYKQRFYLLVEARKHAKDCYKPLIVEYDNKFKFIRERPIDFTFKSGNKGFEAVAHVRRHNKDYLFSLCEGNKCKGSKKGREPGGGRVQVFWKKGKQWLHARTIALPPSLPFVDYSGMSIANGRVAIVSQVNSMLWVSAFDEADWTWSSVGQVYEFPRSENGSICYGNIEGVAWITSTRVVTVSDKRKKKNQPDKGLSEKDQSIHIFEIPTRSVA
jgi:hypothetical protein